MGQNTQATPAPDPKQEASHSIHISRIACPNNRNGNDLCSVPNELRPKYDLINQHYEEIMVLVCWEK